MKKHLVFAALTLVLMAPGLSFAQTAPAPSGMAPMGAPPPAAPAKGQDFQARKAEILQHISAKITQLQQRQSCIQAATNRDAVKACMPPREDRYAK